MSADGFELFVGPHETICLCCDEQRLEQFRANQPQDRYLRFPAGFSASQILQLGEAVTSITGVPEDFGNDTDREESVDMLFVDRLTHEWVAAASKLASYNSGQIEKLWIEACVAEEGERPSWASEPRNALIAQFLHLCVSATSAKTDLVMVWRL
jgi:hypothetical protein